MKELDGIESLKSTSEISPDFPSKASTGSENEAFIHSADVIPSAGQPSTDHVSGNHVCPLERTVSDRSTSPTKPLIREPEIRQRPVMGRECSRDVESGQCATCGIEPAVITSEGHVFLIMKYV